MPRASPELTPTDATIPSSPNSASPSRQGATVTESSVVGVAGVVVVAGLTGGAVESVPPLLQAVTSRTRTAATRNTKRG
jgi:hypothetical protein